MPFASCFKGALVGGVALGLSFGTAQAADLTVSIDGVRDATQTIRICLYDKADGFRHEQRAYQILSLPATPGTVTGVFKDIPAGRYAVLAYHDENGNQKLDLFLGMFPSEGWGLSNDPTVIGPPSFEDSAFDVGDARTSISVPLHY